MATLYNVYNNDTSQYALRLINTPISEDRQTSISLGDDNTRIYTKESGSIQFTTNITIDENLTIGNSITSNKLFTIYSRIGVNISSPYANITTHIRNNNSLTSVTPPTFDTNKKDLLLLENATGSYLQLLSNNTAISGIGFSSNSGRNVSSIEYNHSTSSLSITSGSISFIPTNVAGNTISINSLGELLSNVNYFSVGVATVSGATITADFTKHSIVIVRPTTNNSVITLTLPLINTPPHRMRVLYLLVKSNGSYTLNSSTSLSGQVNLPSDFPISPSANNRYDLYSFLSNGQDLFCTFAYNYSTKTGGTLSSL